MMESYFETLDWVYGHYHQKVTGAQLVALMKTDLDAQHDAGPEAGWIIRCWKEDRGIE